MRIAIHQPNYLPWAGYFYKMSLCDVFVLLDNVQFEKNSYINRTQIKTPQGPFWLTLPVSRNFPQTIDRVELVGYEKEKERHLKAIELNYKKSPFLSFLLSELAEILRKDWALLAPLNIALLELVKNMLGIQTEMRLASDLPTKEGAAADDRLIEICKILGADTYLSGSGGKKYQDEKKFLDEGIRVEYTDFVHPTYSQPWGEFAKGLSIVDFLCAEGPRAKAIFQKQHTS